MKGRVSSYQSMGTLDGPGVRFVVFLQGCPLCCPYCHNPETRDPAGGEEISSEEVVERVLRCCEYFGDKGGVTISGGEPLLQADFAAEVFAALRRKGVHTALDTSGAGNMESAERLLRLTDLVLCDIKFTDDESYMKHCGVSLRQVREFLALTDQLGVELWVRHVVVPGITDSYGCVRAVTDIATEYSNLRKIELLPYSRLSVTKYEHLGIPYPMGNTPECSADTIRRLTELIPENFR